MKRFALLLILVGIALAGWYWASPNLAVNRLRGAIQSADTEEMQEIIDFGAVRETMKADLATVMEGRSRDPNSPLGAALGGMLVGGLVDTFVTPAGLSALLRGNQPASGDDDRTSIEGVSYAIDRDGFSRFQARLEIEGNPDVRPSLTFRRRGLGWRVVRIQVPGIERLVR